jgi:CubicO group peptidase (beta-lactamase class C family)
MARSSSGAVAPQMANGRTVFGRAVLGTVRRGRSGLALAVTTGLLLLGGAVSAEQAAPKGEKFTISAARLDKVHEALERHIQAGDISGAVAGVARGGKVLHYEAQGLVDVEANKPMPLDGLFRMASSTKVVAGVAAMMMIEEGKLKLDDPVAKYIPEFKGAKVAVPKNADVAAQETPAPTAAPGALPNANQEQARPDDYTLVPANRDITVRDLMTHTSGILSGGAGRRAMTPPRRGAGDTLASYIPKLGTMALDFQPGSRWSYSPGTGIDILGRLVEITSGKPFDVFLRERIFEPLGMKDTFFGLPEDRAARLVPLYRRADGKWLKADTANRLTSSTYFSGSGGLSSTAFDYLRFQQMLANGGELEGRRLLKPETVKLMATNQVGDLFRGLRRGGAAGGVGFGLTVQVVEDQAKAQSPRPTGSFGWGGLFGTQNWSNTSENIAVILMIQQPNPAVQADFDRAVGEALAALPK